MPIDVEDLSCKQPRRYLFALRVDEPADGLDELQHVLWHSGSTVGRRMAQTIADAKLALDLSRRRRIAQLRGCAEADG